MPKRMGVWDIVVVSASYPRTHIFKLDDLYIIESKETSPGYPNDESKEHYFSVRRWNSLHFESMNRGRSILAHVCKNCMRVHQMHHMGSCLFASTKWERLTREDLGWRPEKRK